MDEGSVYLRWFRVQNALHYLVERRVGEKGDFKQIAKVDNPAYRDFSVIDGQVHFYRIVPLDLNGEKGPTSEVRYILLPSLEKEALSPPNWQAHRIMENGIALSWYHENFDNILAFNIYRRKEGEATYTLVTGSMGTTYLDRDVSPGVTYYYALTALDKKLQESNFSDAVKVPFARIVPKHTEEDRLRDIKTLEEVVSRTALESMYSWEDYGFVSPVDVEYFALNGFFYVSDSGTGLITVIGQRGQIINQLGGRIEIGLSGFERLLGIAVDSFGFVYGLDAYRGEIVVFNPSGNFDRRIGLVAKVREYFGAGFESRYPGFRFGIVDVNVADDGSLIVVDNPNGWIYVLDPYDNLVRVISQKGYEKTRMQYPTFAVLDRKNRIIISDTLNSRVQVFGFDGTHIDNFGARGFGIGQFLRPKGLALDQMGNVYVADSQLNAVQVFDSRFQFKTLLGDEKGFPIDLGSPNGVAFIEPDLIAICEKLSRRIQVRRFLNSPLGK